MSFDTIEINLVPVFVDVFVGWEFLNNIFAFNIVGIELELWQYYSHDRKHLTLPNHANQTKPNQTRFRVTFPPYSS